MIIKPKVLTGLPSMCRPVIFSILFIVACRNQDNPSATSITIRWKDDKATTLFIPKKRVGDISKDSLAHQLQIKLVSEKPQPAMAGEYHVEEDAYIFEPLIPFTRGSSYQIWVKQELFDEIEIPRANEIPRLLAIYPSADTLPENLLKIYLRFSRPMQEGHSTQYVTLEDQQGKVLLHSFLYLESELWNEDRTELTLWLDPGRIKRDLQPNQSEGPPLVKGNSYKLVISGEWKDQSGNSLGKSYTKEFVAADRDSVSPSPDKWILGIPEKNTIQPLTIEFGESLDYILLLNTITISDSNGNKLTGTFRVAGKENLYHFTPQQPWVIGNYQLIIEARLADLAGNNLNRLFDVDLGKKSEIKPAKEIYERKWKID